MKRAAAAALNMALQILSIFSNSFWIKGDEITKENHTLTLCYFLQTFQFNSSDINSIGDKSRDCGGQDIISTIVFLF